MSFVGDLLLDILAEGLSPESTKTRFIFFGLLGLAFAAVDAWLIAVSANPLNELHWSFGALVCSVVYGSI